MEPGLAASRQYDFARRAAPIVGGGALAVSAAFLGTHDPAAAGSRFPACAFHQITGLWCPGCGLTRGTYQLLHGHVGAALSYNVFTPVALVAIIVVWVGWLRVSWGAAAPHVPARTAHWLAVGIPTLLVVYGVLRNIPVDAMRTLAP